MADKEKSSTAQVDTAATTPPRTPDAAPDVPVSKPVVLKHRDGRTRTVSTPQEAVAARFDGFAKEAPEDVVFGQGKKSS